MLKTIKNRLLSAAIAAGLILNSFGTVTAFEYVTQFSEPKGEEIVIEAEAFTGSGFSVKDESSASGGKVLVSGSGKVSYTFTLDSKVENLTVYGIHKSKSKNEALTHISLEGFEHYSLYDYEYNVWNSTRLYFGNANAGNYTINLTGVREGQFIDKIIVKYDKVAPVEESEPAQTVQKEEPAEDLSKYRPGNPELENKAYAVIEEGVSGSFMAECEDGTFDKQNGAVISKDGASGGKAYINISDADNRESSGGETELRFKFYVSQNGKYRCWLRYFTPDPNQKDAWISFDGIGWNECLDGTISTDFKWKNFFNVDLGVGWHTLEVKHRTTGWIMDKFVITSDSAYSPSGVGALPGQAVAGDNSAAKLVESKRLNPKFKCNNFRIRSDWEFEHVDGDIMVPSTNIAGAIGVNQQQKDGYFLILRDRQYMKFYDGSERVISSGKVINSPVASHRTEDEDDIIMVSLKAAQETFGFDYEYDAAENTIHIFDNYIDGIRAATEDEITFEPDKKTIYYTIPYPNPDAKIEVWFRYSLNDTGGVRSQNWDNLNKLESGGSDYKLMDQYNGHGANIWWRAQTPVYSDGAFRGVQFVGEDRNYYVKVIITDNGKQDAFIAYSPSPLGWESSLSPEEYKYNTNGELLLVPTFENIGYYIDTDAGDNASCEINYRKVGENDWKKVYKPMHDTETDQFRGTIPFVTQDTEYEVKAQISVGGSVVKESIATVHTWQDNPPIAQTIKLSDIYSGSGDLMLRNLKGTADGWIKIDGEGKCVNAGKDFYNAVTISECEYLIFENVKVRGGTDFGIIIDPKCHDIRIVNCDIAQWGTGSVQDRDLGSHYRAGNNTNQRAGIEAVSSVNLVVERCYIHDSDTNSNAWKNHNYSNVHPMGSTAIMMWGQKGTVIRYNDLIGSDLHRYNDVLEAASNGNRGVGSTGSDSDVYGNLLMFSNDDAMEMDGAQMNTRVYQNRIEQTYCGISTAPMKMGPGYIYRNQITNPGDETERVGTAMKTGGSSDHWPRIYFFNNMFRTSGGCLRNANYNGSTEWHGTTRNTIFAAYSATGTYGSGRSLENTFADERDDFDYDLLCGTYIIPAGSEKNGIFGTPEFVNDKAGNFNLVEGSPGWKAGAPVDGFTATDTPHMGVFAGDEYDENFLPARPIDMSANAYTLNIAPGEEATIKINVGNVEAGQTYSFVKNRDFDFIKILNEQTENLPLEAGSTIELKLKSEVAGKAVVLVKLDNGLSVPIAIYCK